jgi:hypothetical protein
MSIVEVNESTPRETPQLSQLSQLSLKATNDGFDMRCAAMAIACAARE